MLKILEDVVTEEADRKRVGLLIGKLRDRTEMRYKTPFQRLMTFH